MRHGHAQLRERLVGIARLRERTRGRIRVVAEARHPLVLAAEHQPRVDLTAHFPSAAPVFESDLFYTVDLSDLVVRYER